MRPLWAKSGDIARLLHTINGPAPCGPLADTDIWDAIYRGEIYISPFCKENLTAAGYNLQISDIIISTKTGLPLKIDSSGQKRYVDVPANDTVLITTVESIFVGPQIMAREAVNSIWNGALGILTGAIILIVNDLFEGKRE